ncbi:MAG: hypothetical protein GIW94_11760 [Candidatus Eremiobacteraeota bacterium]|nr:hypothetical protein [Candidatus Eremiobacteraeota bacterium]
MFVHRLKLRSPQLLPAWIHRPGLCSRFDPSASVLSIVAAPGYGKTVLAVQRYEAWTGPKAWYSLDGDDADLAVFAVHLDTMIRSLGAKPPFDGDTWRVGSPKEVGSIFAEMLSAIPRSPLIVFDDVDALEGSRSLTALEEFMQRATRGGAAFVVTGRSMPLALHAFAVGSRLATVTARDLAFDAAESRAYLSRTARDGHDQVSLERLAERAEGWPAGLALVATAASLGNAPAAPDVLGSPDDLTRPLLFAYLAEEVLDGLGAAERLFLLETSVLDVLDAELCEALTGRSDAGPILSSLCARGLFVTHDTGDAYKTHQLFHEFLQDTLLQTRDRADVAALHRRAAAALGQRGDRAAQIEHLLDAGDADDAAAVLETAAFAMLSGGLLARVAALLQRIGNARIEASPTLLIARGKLAQLRGDWDPALGSLERAIRDAHELEQYDVLAEAVRVLAPILASRGEFAHLFALLDQTLALGDKMTESSRTALAMTLGAVLLENDRFDEALRVFGEIMPSVTTRGDLALQGMVLHNTGVAHARRGDPYAALVFYERALKVKRSAGQRVSALLTLNNRINLLRTLGDYDDAETLTAEFLAEAYDIGNAHLVAHAHENEGALKLVRGEPDAAQAAFCKAQAACDPADVLALPDVLQGLGRTALALERYADADDACVKAINLLRTAKRRAFTAPVLVTRLEVAIAAGEVSRAVALAREALASVADAPDAVMRASVNLDVAAALAGVLPRLSAADAAEAESLAASAATTAVALVHQRDYRFLVRTKNAFAQLQPHLRRWGIGAAREHKAAAAPSLRIDMLGGFRIAVQGEPLPPQAWKRRKARDIFAFLVSLRGTPVPRSRLTDLFWSDAEADAAHDNLRVTISAIRKAVGDVVKFEGNAYRFVPPPRAQVDIDLFEAHLEGARQALGSGRHDVARREYAAAADLYHGEFLDGIEDGGWQWRERERLHAAALEALRWLAADREGEPEFRRHMLERLLEIAPFELAAVRSRLDLMAAQMRVSDACRDYAAWKARYRAAVGAEPPEVWAPPPATAAAGRVRGLLQARA